MSVRRQLPVSSPLAFPTLAAALWPTITRGAGGLLDAAAALREMYETPRVALTDSGTSALVMALRLTVGKGGTVALPGYAWVDLAAGARFARVRVRLYDIDPRTLSPDLDSLAAAVRRGAKAIVVAHLYGFPADMNGVDEIASRFGIPVIEDAAQAAGGTLHGRPLGGFGALSVLSFGRGKGTTGGRGGALLGYDVAFDDAFAREMTALDAPAQGWSDLAAAGAQWVMGRPGLYGIPSAIPALRLGEMVYHPAHAPRSLSAAAAALGTLRVALLPWAAAIVVHGVVVSRARCEKRVAARTLCGLVLAVVLLAAGCAHATTPLVFVALFAASCAVCCVRSAFAGAMLDAGWPLLDAVVLAACGHPVIAIECLAVVPLARRLALLDPAIF